MKNRDEVLVFHGDAGPSANLSAQLPISETAEEHRVPIVYVRHSMPAVPFIRLRLRHATASCTQGVTPARDYLRRLLRNGFGGDFRTAVRKVPTLLWFLPTEVSGDTEMDTGVLTLFVSYVSLVGNVSWNKSSFRIRGSCYSIQLTDLL